MTTTTNNRAGRTTPQVIFGLIATLLAGAVAAYLLGKDLNWDFYNYHLYSPLAYWTQDLKSEFMGAGMQRYLNPLGYLPFYSTASQCFSCGVFAMGTYSRMGIADGIGLRLPSHLASARRSF
ncbi:MAG: hypothetical protein LW865_09655 [Betaproteobacteria bacterium]|nr:hypothetical protein [Betaproteobacteria bacterium]